MNKFILARLLQTIPVLILVSILTFAGLELVPGDPVEALIGPANEGNPIDAEGIERLKEQFGLTGSLPERYYNYIERVVVHFDFGKSLQSQRPVTQVIGERLPISLWLNGLALAVSIIVGLTLGLLAGVRPGTRGDLGVTFLAVVGVAAPSFWLAIGLIIVFSLELGWLPASGWVSPTSDLWDGLKHLAMPVFALSLGGIAVIARQTRSSVLEVRRQDYIVTARAKGLTGMAVIFRHVMKNAMLPIVTIMGLQIGALFGGSVIIERLFAMPGLGRLAFDSTLNHDYRLLQGIVMLVTIAVVFANLLTDVAYAYLDPRIRYQ